MMNDYVITCCSTADLSEEVFAANGITYVPFTFHLDGQDYDDDYGKSFKIKDFYEAMRNGHSPTTSQVSVGRYEEIWRPLLEKGHDIIHITLSSGISGTYNSALLAKGALLEEYPQRKIAVIDSLCASSGYGLLVIEALEYQKAGHSFDECVKWIEEMRLNVHHWFFPSELTYLVRGGRVSKVSGFVGNTLHICPLMNVDNTGHLIPRAKIRGKKKVIAAQIEKMKEHALKGIDYDGTVYICNSDCMEDALYLKENVLATFPKVKEVNIYSIGTVIGSHTGPGTLGLFFIGDKRID